MMQDIIMAGELVNEKMKPLGISIQWQRFVQKKNEILLKGQTVEIYFLPSSRPQTLGMTCRTWLQAESSRQSCLARRHPRLPEVGVEKTPVMMGYSWGWGRGLMMLGGSN